MVVGVNHTAHFLLLNYSQDRTKRIVMLGSVMHDSTDVKSLQPLDMANVQRLAKDLDQCKRATKFDRRFQEGVDILAYTLGFTPDTGLFRDFNFALRIFFKYVATFDNWWSGGRNSTPEYSGGYIARIASAAAWETNGRKAGNYIRVDGVGGVGAGLRCSAGQSALGDDQRVGPAICELSC